MFYYNVFELCITCVSENFCVFSVLFIKAYTAYLKIVSDHRSFFKEDQHNFTRRMRNVTLELESQIDDDGHESMNWIELAEDNG
jgi:hypothetical protein